MENFTEKEPNFTTEFNNRLEGFGLTEKFAQEIKSKNFPQEINLNNLCSYSNTSEWNHLLSIIDFYYPGILTQYYSNIPLENYLQNSKITNNNFKEYNRKLNKRYPFEGPNPTAVWSVNDNLDELHEIKKILQEKSKRKWVIFYPTTVVMILFSFLIYYYVKESIIFITTIIIFLYILYIQISKLKRLKYLKIDLDSRIEQMEKRKIKCIKEIEKILAES
ncbi:hypothetical protein LPB90_18380 [Chryseobacterium sp. LC2016-29]|uniref:hypothetical protein n=1 Tax=Chryseobacterium sp. LC2016-29 TaxID=2897331 RepID=UPI001E5FEE52|nr:hypothetical protein [Chryseobacterium sp. LC2016-29]MCD0480410.1 hypothetical protein [Chryseobacterium sp. LC2016-29]